MRKAVSGSSNIDFFSFGIRLEEGSPSLVFGYRNSQDGSAMLVSSSVVNITGGVWHHVGVSVRPNSPNLEFYVDGIEVGMSDLHNGKIESGVGALTVGSSFSGLLQDVRIYTRPLVGSQMEQLAAGVTYLSGAVILPYCLCTAIEPSVSPTDERVCQSQNGSSEVER